MQSQPRGLQINFAQARARRAHEARLAAITQDIRELVLDVVDLAHQRYWRKVLGLNDKPIFDEDFNQFVLDFWLATNEWPPEYKHTDWDSDSESIGETQ